jgi:hypothetical protein
LNCTIVLLCQGLIFEESDSGTISLAFSGFVVFLMLCCVLFNIWRGMKKALHVELTTVEIPSAAFSNSVVSHHTSMEVYQLHSLCRLEEFGELEINIPRMLRVANSEKKQSILF